MPRKYTPAEREAAFWAKVRRTHTCWIWTAATNDHGYGQVWLDGKVVYAHRVTYERFVGPDPVVLWAGMMLVALAFITATTEGEK